MCTHDDFGEIPDELVAQRPEVDDPTYWEAMMDSWGTVGGGGGFILLAGLFLLILDGVQLVEFRYDFEFCGSLAFVGSTVVVVVATGLFILARLGQFLEDVGVNERLREGVARRRDRVYR